jgi:hypothetical protein
MVEYYKTNKGYCYKKTKKYGSIRISLEDYKKEMSKNGGVGKRKLNNVKKGNVTNNNVKNVNVTSRSSTGRVTVRNRNNNTNNNRSNKKKKPRKNSSRYNDSNNDSNYYYYSKTNNEERQRREELTNELKKKFRKEDLPIDENVIKIIINKTLKEESNAKKLFENPKLTKNVWEFQMNIPGTFKNLESRQQMKKKLNQTERNRRKEIINAPRSPNKEKSRKKIVANILSNKNKVLPLNIANRIANMSREQPPPPPPPPRTHAEIQANNNQLDNDFWDDI